MPSQTLQLQTTKCTRPFRSGPPCVQHFAVWGVGKHPHTHTHTHTHMHMHPHAHVNTHTTHVYTYIRTCAFLHTFSRRSLRIQWLYITPYTHTQHIFDTIIEYTVTQWLHICIIKENTHVSTRIYTCIRLYSTHTARSLRTQ